MDNYFSTNLKHLRTQRGMTQNNLAKLLKKNYSTIGKWELGERNPSTLDLFRIAEIFNVSANDIIYKNIKELDEKPIKLTQNEIFFNNNKQYLNESDWNIINTIVEQRKNEKENDDK